MTHAERLAAHVLLCDELYQLTAEENQFLKRERRPPDEAWRERKRALAARWDESLRLLREREANPPPGGTDLEHARQRCLQILHLDRENEQLLLRCSLSPARPAPTLPASAAALKIYGGKP